MADPKPEKKQAPNVFTQEEGQIHLGGIDAIVRLTLDQVRTDARRGLKTGMFVSGYRGSPVGMLDAALLKQQKLLLSQHIHFVDGLNEDLAATAVWGTQMLHTVGKQKFDGVTGLWYGKAPGVDRSGDALKHANYTGIAHNGGVLAIAGDDPSCKSSSLPSQSEPMLMHVGMPSLYPSNVQEILDYGLHGYQMSRLSGLWVGMKIVTNVADGTGTAEVSPGRMRFAEPDLEFDGQRFTPHMNLGMNVRAQALEMEQSLYTRRLEVAKRYAAVNRLNDVVFENPDAWLGIITAGKTYNDLRQSFLELGLDDAALRRYGIRILKMGMLFPMEPGVVRDFAKGLEEIFVIEEKRPFLEMFAKNVLYGMANAPRIVGKFDEHEKELLPHYGEFESDVIGRALTARLSKKARVESAEAWIRRLDEVHARAKLTETSTRTAWFCSGCPHNSSTAAPEGSIVSAGIGCHTMAMWMDRNVVMGTHMGAEGAQWIGMAPFTDTPHIFQNMGDGTYAHSGSLAIRYAAANNANITFKLLRNAHTSMTGGQAIMGAHPVAAMVADLLANGVKKIIVTTDDLGPYKNVALAGGTEAWHRDRLDEAQRLLAATPGTTVLLHDQECAAELRRARSRGKAEEPVEVTVINERVCEGCGDCGEKSNCMSVEPVPTEFGRKTRIHQSSCNKDFSCVKGFCPSFLTITPNPDPGAGEGKKKKKGRIPALTRELPAPVPKIDASFGFSVHIMGIGGTGSVTVTVTATIAAAARLEGKHVMGLDQTGLAQKGGAVISDIKITNAPFDGSNKVSDGRSDLYLGFDILNATDPKNLDKCHPERTIAVVSTTQTPTGQMVANRNVLFPAPRVLTAGIDRVTRKADNVFLDGQALAEGLFGDAMATNTFMVGVAFQAGTIPLKAESIETAIQNAGVGVEQGIAAFRWGRMVVVDRAFVEAEVAKAKGTAPVIAALSAEAAAIVDGTGAKGELKRLLQVRVPELIAFQDAAYARRYAAQVQRVLAAEHKAAPGHSALAEATARYLYKLMAYKDEYEVARLHSDPAFLAQLDAQFPHGYTVQYNLAPPTISKRDPVTGHLIKQKFGPWMKSAFTWLGRLKGLRGGALDVFGKTEERRAERGLITDYERMLDEVVVQLDASNHAAAVQLACVPDEIRGYGHVKEKSMAQAELLRAQRLQTFRTRRAGSATTQLQAQPEPQPESLAA